MKIELSEEDSELLTLVLGYAAGVANLRGEGKFFNRILRLTNTIHEGRPNWTPYEIPTPADSLPK